MKKPVQLQLVHLNDQSLDRYELLLELEKCAKPSRWPPPAAALVYRGERIIAGCTLIPEQGVIFLEAAALDTMRNIRRLWVPALQLAIQSILMTSTVLNMPVACRVPTSKALRRFLLRAGFVQREDPALLVREPGMVVTRRG